MKMILTAQYMYELPDNLDRRAEIYNGETEPHACARIDEHNPPEEIIRFASLINYSIEPHG